MCNDNFDKSNEIQPTFHGKTLEELKRFYAKKREERTDFYKNSQPMMNERQYIRLKRFSKLMLSIQPSKRFFAQASDKKTQEIFSRMLKRLHFGNTKQEELLIIYLDSKFEILSELVLSNNSVDNVLIDINKMLDNLPFKQSCTGIVLAHNHPNCNPYPSAEDMVACNHIIDSISRFGITLFDSFVITDSTIVGILSNTMINY